MGGVREQIIREELGTTRIEGVTDVAFDDLCAAVKAWLVTDYGTGKEQELADPPYVKARHIRANFDSANPQRAGKVCVRLHDAGYLERRTSPTANGATYRFTDALVGYSPPRADVMHARQLTGAADTDADTEADE